MWRRFVSRRYRDLEDFLVWAVDFSKVTNKDFWTSPRKQAFFSVYLAIALVLLSIILVYGKQFEVFSRSQIVHLFFVFFILEPCFLVAQAIILKLTPIELEASPLKEKEDNQNIGVIITCHRSEEDIVATVDACLKHFDPSQIFVIDNSSNIEDDTERKTQIALFEADMHFVHYIFQSIGNKTLAVYAGAIAAKDFDFLLLLDDDTRLPADMTFDDSLFATESVRAICYPIRARGTQSEPRFETIMVKWQELEYKISDYGKRFQSRFSTVLYPHGAISLWERETLISCLREHDTVFYGDDVKMGLWLQENNYKLIMDHRHIIDTEAHETWSGLYKQRVRSWDMAEHVLMPNHCRALLKMRHPNHNFWGVLVLKWFQFYACFCIVVDWIRIPVLVVTFWFSPLWLYPFGVLVCLQVVTVTAIFAWDFIANHRDERSDWIVIMTYPFFKLPLTFQRWLALGVAYFEYLPNFEPKQNIPDLEKKFADDNSANFNPRCPVWLRQWDFDTGHYFTHYDPMTPLAVRSAPNGTEQQSSGQDAGEQDPSLAFRRPICTEELQFRTSTIPQLSEDEAEARDHILNYLRSGQELDFDIKSILEKFPRVVYLKDTAGNYLVHIACMSSMTPYPILREIVRASPRKIPANRDENTALHIACREGATKRVLDLLVEKWRSAIRMPNKLDRLPLHLANSVSVDAMKFLVEKYEYAVSLKDKEGNYPLHCVCATVPEWEAAEFLLQKFSQAASESNSQGSLPLHLASEDSRNRNLILALAEVKPSTIFIPNGKKELPIHIACRSGCSIDVIKGLYSEGHLQTVDFSGNTPLHSLCASTPTLMDPSILEWFISLDPIGPKLTNKAGSLPIHLYCASIGYMGFATSRGLSALETLHTLNEESRFVQNEDDQTPLHVACSIGPPHVQVLLCLLRGTPSGVLRKVDRKGFTPLHRACTHKHVSVEALRCLVQACGQQDTTQRESEESIPNTASDMTSQPSSRPRSSQGDQGSCSSGDSTLQVVNHPNVGSDNGSIVGSLSAEESGTDNNWLRTTRGGDTPLHLAYQYGASDEVISFLSHVFPNMENMRNQWGLTPHQLRDRLIESRRKDRTASAFLSDTNTRLFQPLPTLVEKTDDNLLHYHDSQER